MARRKKSKIKHIPNFRERVIRFLMMVWQLLSNIFAQNQAKKKRDSDKGTHTESSGVKDRYNENLVESPVRTGACVKAEFPGDNSPNAGVSPSNSSAESSGIHDPLLFLKFESATFPIGQSGVSSTHSFRIHYDKNPLHVVQIDTDSRTTLHTYKYSFTLRDFLSKMGSSIFKDIFPKSTYPKRVPREPIRSLIRAILNAYIELGSEPHNGLDLIDNYVIWQPPTHPNRDDVVLKWDYDELLVVRIIHNVESPGMKVAMEAALDDKLYDMRNEAVSTLIFEKIFQGEKLDKEWEDFRISLISGKLYYCQQHPVLKHWEKRLLAFVQMAETISNKTSDHADLFYNAITSCNEDELYMKTWNLDRLDAHPPLQQVRDFHGEINTPIKLRNLWVEGGRLIKFISNCYRHLTESTWMTTNRVHHVQIKRGWPNEKEYRQLRFLDHLITYVVYPGLLLVLYKKIFDWGFEFL